MGFTLPVARVARVLFLSLLARNVRFWARRSQILIWRPRYPRQAGWQADWSGWAPGGASLPAAALRSFQLDTCPAQTAANDEVCVGSLRRQHLKGKIDVYMYLRTYGMPV